MAKITMFQGYEGEPPFPKPKEKVLQIQRERPQHRQKATKKANRAPKTSQREPQYIFKIIFKSQALIFEDVSLGF